MKAKEFNEKYKDYLEDGHYGCAILNENAIDYLDKEFEELIKIPGFKFYQIKSKWNNYCVYCNNVTNIERLAQIEMNLKKICSNEST